MARQPEGVSTMKFVALLSTWYLVTLFSNMSGKSFVKRTLDAMAPTTVSLGCASFVYAVHQLFNRKDEHVKTSLSRELPSPALELHKWAAVIGFVQFLATAMTYASFALSSVSWTYCFRTLEPLISAAVQYFTFHKKLSLKEIASLAVLAAGIAITVNAGSAGQTYSPWIGGLALTATAIYSTRSVSGSHIMQSYGVRGRELFLLASVYGFGFSIFMQIAAFSFHWNMDQTWTWTLVRELAFTGVFHCIYNLMSFQILQLLQPIAHGVCNTMKRVFMVLVSAGLAGQWLTYPQIFGILVANTSAGVYSIEAKRKKAQETIPVSAVVDHNLEKTLVRKLMIWNFSILVFGLMYLVMALCGLSSWKSSTEHDAEKTWNAQQFFDSLIYGASLSRVELNQTVSAGSR